MSTAVREILERIEQLSQEDRLVLDRYLAEQAEAEAARRQAREQGLNQEAIDRGIDEMRYP